VDVAADQGEQQIRRRDSNASRAALLDAAAELFAERGYDRTTVRDIATRAGLNQALLFRYFGSKQALFAAVVARSGRDRLAETPREELLANILRAVLEGKRRDNTLDIMLRSSGEDTAARNINNELGDEYRRALAELTDQDDSDLRAHLVLAWIAGIDLVRSVSEAEPLASADPERIVGYVLPSIQMLLERVRDVSPE
jgi:AcrR family transcriptional regulator